MFCEEMVTSWLENMIWKIGILSLSIVRRKRDVKIQSWLRLYIRRMRLFYKKIKRRSVIISQNT